MHDFGGRSVNVASWNPTMQKIQCFIRSNPFWQSLQVHSFQYHTTYDVKFVTLLPPSLRYYWHIGERCIIIAFEECQPCKRYSFRSNPPRQLLRSKCILSNNTIWCKFFLTLLPLSLRYYWQICERCVIIAFEESNRAKDSVSYRIKPARIWRLLQIHDFQICQMM